MKFINKVLVFFLILSFSFLINSNMVFAAPEGLNDNDLGVSFEVWIHDVNTQDLMAIGDVRIMISGFPVDADYVAIMLRDTEDHIVNCNRTNPYNYHGEIDAVQFKLYGIGDMFPYDFYNLDVMIYPRYYGYNDDAIYHYWYEYNNTDYSVSQIQVVYLNGSSALFDGNKKVHLYDTWKTKDGIFLESMSLPYKTKFYLERFSNVWYSQFILPILLSMIILLSTIFFIKGYNDHILTICSMFLIFSPLNMINIRYALPHAKIMTLPEFYSLFMFLITLGFILKFLAAKSIYNRGPPKYISLISDLLDIGFMYLFFFSHRSLFFLIYDSIREEVISLSAIDLLNRVSFNLSVILGLKLFLFIFSKNFIILKNLLKSRMIQNKR